MVPKRIKIISIDRLKYVEVKVNFECINYTI